MYVIGLHAVQLGNKWMKKFRGQPKLNEAVGRRPSLSFFKFHQNMTKSCMKLMARDIFQLSRFATLHLRSAKFCTLGSVLALVVASYVRKLLC